MRSCWDLASWLYESILRKIEIKHHVEKKEHHIYDTHSTLLGDIPGEVLAL